MTPLDREIRETILSEGPISLERYMSLCLGHPAHGYYMTRDPFGAAGDFVTAPEVSQMFGELLGLWAAECWVMMGAPATLRLVEIGPGRGTLMADALRAAGIVAPFREALRVHMVETSPVLREAQKRRLESTGVPVEWHSDVDEIPEGPAVFLANEFFDALPVRHYLKTPRGWCERMVGLDAEGALAFGLSPDPEPYIRGDAPDGAVLEVAPAMQRIMARIAARLVAQRGALLAIDYGHVDTQLGETLQAVKAHRFCDPLRDAGECDLTAHVDFAALARAARASGASVQGPVTQGEFLVRLGIVQRAQMLTRKADAAQASAVASALQRLTGADKASMGELFKVIAVTDPAMPPLPGFA